ncbi:hypothetical protein [Methanoregula sp.]|uniref:hypothetical protein n=1 Tax=Methanoregula sp. TaxID=2052170 RepID=UPI002C4B4062|nr:hypothetical protein [Methanoregula sp.]HVP95523.1 hypothetical protein [Methanoregula sp.]
MKRLSTIGHALAAICILFLLGTAASAAGTSGLTGPGQGSGQGENSIQNYTISQTISDQAQEDTIAFDGLAFMTGSACSDTFIPPGKVADYAGFQYLRDNDPTGMGHNTDFVTRTADNVLVMLNTDQLAQFVTLAQEENSLQEQYALMRFPLATAFRDNLEGNIPAGSSGLNQSAVMAYSAKLYDVDASISIARAKTYASVINSLNQTQRAYLDKLKSEGEADYPVVDASSVLANSGQGNSVAMRTYASEMFAWYAGSVTADTYFCPERQATYFGSFYMKDLPAMGNADYSISTTLTGDSGANFLNLLTDTQRSEVTGLVDLQKSDLNEIVATRQAIATDLRAALSGNTIDETDVRSLSAKYGKLDGEISYYYATHFAAVDATLTDSQKQQMVALRNLTGYTCTGAFLYSQPISMPQNIPSDFLFGVGTYNATEMSAWVQGQEQALSSQDQGNGQNSRQGSGQGQTTQGSVTSPAGNSTAPGQSTGQGQQRRMPLDMIITQLGQKGYDISGATAAIQSGDRQAQKAWLDTFEQSNPGVVEAIEANWTGNSQNGNGGSGSSPAPSGGQPQPAGTSGSNPVNSWFADFWQSLWSAKSSGTPQNGPVPAGTGAGTFTLMSDAGADGGTMSAAYTCDGAGNTPELSWSGAPTGTKEYALMMTTLPGDGTTRWNWVLYGIPGTTTSLAQNSTGTGTLGTGSHGTVMQYDPPCSQGPGLKTYTFTLYALSGSPSLPADPAQVTGPVLTSAIAPVTLGTASLNLSYTRPSGTV